MAAMAAANFKRGYVSLGTPGFTPLVGLVIEGPIWTWSARTCADNRVELASQLNISCKMIVYVPKLCLFSVYLRFSVGS